MADLINVFSWSISAREDFNECRRLRYWAKYAMWNGWQEGASQLQRTAYRLSKIKNRFALQGIAVERAVMWALRQQQAGRIVTTDEAYAAAAKPFLNQCWSESRRGLWRSNPRKYCCLHEHYYASLYQDAEDAMTTKMISRVRQCIANFIANNLPALSSIRAEQEIPLALPESGDPESFRIDDLKVYAIPDYVYRADNRLHIHDWKSGGPQSAHSDQMFVYGLWANIKHHIPADQIYVHLEYLWPGKTFSKGLKEEAMQSARQLVLESAAEMAEYLEDGNLHKNKPLPLDEWEQSANIAFCRRCNFFELCQGELQV